MVFGVGDEGRYIRRSLYRGRLLALLEACPVPARQRRYDSNHKQLKVEVGISACVIHIKNLNFAPGDGHGDYGSMDPRDHDKARLCQGCLPTERKSSAWLTPLISVATTKSLCVYGILHYHSNDSPEGRRLTHPACSIVM